MSVRHENVKWVDVSALLTSACVPGDLTKGAQGLRGIASLLVVFTHIARAFDEALFRPSTSLEVAPRILQYPFLRVLVQGRIGVSIFALVTGYVCALKPIRQCRAGKQDEAFVGISKSAFRRLPRLVLPASLATALIWLIAQFGLFEVAKHSEGWWINFTAPPITPFIGQAIKTLFHQILTTWTTKSNMYDVNQWTMLPLLKGSMVVYTMLVATAYTRPRYRMMVALGMFVYYYISNEGESHP